MTVTRFSAANRRSIATLLIAFVFAAFTGVVLAAPAQANANCQAYTGFDLNKADTCSFTNSSASRGVTFTHHLLGPLCSDPGVVATDNAPCVYGVSVSNPSGAAPSCNLGLTNYLGVYQVNIPKYGRSFSCTTPNEVSTVVEAYVRPGYSILEARTVFVSPKPVAGFTATQADPAKSPGKYQFVSTSTDPIGAGLQYARNFGDGQTSSGGATVTHTYTYPGTFFASLTVTDGNGTPNTANQQLDVAPTKLSVAAAIVGDTGFVTPGKTIKVDVTVSADSAGLGPVNNVAWDKSTPGGLAVAPSDVGTVTPLGSTSLPTTFARGDTRTFHYAIAISKNYTGSGSFTSQVDGTDGNGNPVTPSDSHNLKISNHAITVTIVPEKETIVLKPDAAGNPIPQVLAVTVTTTNTGTKLVDNVVLDKLDLANADPNHPSDPFPVSVIGNNTGVTYGTLQPGESHHVVFSLKVAGDGSFAVTDLEHSDDGPVLGKGSFDAGLKTLLVVKIDGDTNRVVKAGQSVTFTGSYKNVSETKTLVLTDPSRVIRSGNLLGGGYIAADTGDAFPAPLTGTIKPGQSLNFQVQFRAGTPTSTDYEADAQNNPDWTRGKVSFAFAPHAAVLESDGTYSSLTTADPPTTSKYPSSIKVSGGSGGAFDVAVDTTPPSDGRVIDRAVPAAFGFTIGALQGAEESMTNLATLLADGAQALALPFSDAFYSSSTYLSLARMGEQSQVQDALKFLSDMAVWAPKADLDQLATSVAQNVHTAFDRFNAVVVDGVPHPAIPGVAELRAQEEKYFTHLQTAWNMDDPNAIVDAIRPAGTAAGGTATDFLLQEALLQGLLNGLQTSGKLYEAARLNWSESRTIAQMEKNLPSAAQETIRLKAQKLSKSRYPLLENAYLTRTALSDTDLGIGTANNGAGLSASTITAARRVTQDNPDLLMVVIPNEANVAALRDANLAVDKIENVKPKSMATLEKLVYGGRDEDLNCVVLRNLGKYWDDAKVNAKMDQLIAAGQATEDDRAVALQMLHDREAEWAAFRARGKPEMIDGKYVLQDGNYVPQRDAQGHVIMDGDAIGRLATYDEAGAIPNQFRGVDNGLTVAGEKQNIPFKLEYFNSGGGYDAVKATEADYVVLTQQNPTNKKMVKIAGDDDGIFIGYRNGLGLRQDEINTVYSGLTTVFNHPFSDTWLAGLDKKLKIFSKYFTKATDTGSEGAPLIGFVNGQAFAVKVDPYATRFSPTNRALIKFEGLPTTSGPSGTLRAFKQAFQNQVKPPPLSARYLQLFLGTQNALDHPTLIKNGRSAKIVRVGSNGNLQAWKPDTGWVDDVADQALAGAGKLVIAPQTTVSGDTKPGDVELAISSQADNLQTGAWFQIGDEVVIDPGGPNQENATITAFGSFIFKGGMRKSHHLGEVVALLKAGSGTPASRPSGAGSSGGSGGVDSGGGGSYGGILGSSSQATGSSGASTQATSGGLSPASPSASSPQPSHHGAVAAGKAPAAANTGMDFARLLAVAALLAMCGAAAIVLFWRRRRRVHGSPG